MIPTKKVKEGFLTPNHLKTYLGETDCQGSTPGTDGLSADTFVENRCGFV